MFNPNNDFLRFCLYENTIEETAPPPFFKQIPGTQLKQIFPFTARLIYQFSAAQESEKQYQSKHLPYVAEAPFSGKKSNCNF